jgi:putative endonuclease
MAQHNDTGREGEEMALQFLKNKGFEILATNWSYRGKEIDIVAKDRKELAIIEVKTRTSKSFATPYSAVTREKQRFLVQAANSYVQMNNIDLDVRFDIVSIVKLLNKEPEIEYIENAFYPLVR